MLMLSISCLPRLSPDVFLPLSHCICKPKNINKAPRYALSTWHSSNDGTGERRA